MSARYQYGSTVKCYGCGQDYDADPENGPWDAGREATRIHRAHTHEINPQLAECQLDRDEWLRHAYGWEG